ncbi:MAG: rod shape-determining protein MreD [Acaryochloris sp. RU_4_1]|nr:rod shape-determining protein MreD [Acaryochloris sp. SU_5_25]NJM66797.1 rod shape-determining protein MreD [Acaryochloris sp. RU_4_1]NJN37897.1 rod shape-determining protein MreD [Acaryochloridaceae cyanobacterium CSU_3_4]NJR55422.1 rod shape-determining protein MreD [Acaryochloris sp. CRU_2_0]
MIKPLPLRKQSLLNLHLWNSGIILGSVLLCSVMMLLRLPAMVLSGIGPNWLLVWVVTWSVKRTTLQGTMAGICLGLIQDGLTASQPTHTMGLALVGLLTGRLNTKRFLQEDFISIALIVFAMALMVEATAAIQFGLGGTHRLEDVWLHFRQTALSSAILSSFWAPVVYFPLNRWWERYHRLLGIE